MPPIYSAAGTRIDRTGQPPAILDENGQPFRQHNSSDLDQLSELLGPDGEPLAPKGFALPQIYTFAGVVNVANRTYWSRWDEAYSQSRENALAMRRDCYLMGLLRERQLPSEQLAWHLEAEDDTDPEQSDAVDYLTRIVKTIPRKSRLFRSCLEAIWYGRSGAQTAWGWKPMHWKPSDEGGGTIEAGVRKVYTITGHQHTNGDKIQFGWDGVPTILIYGTAAQELEAQGGTVVYTDVNAALRLDKPSWRDRWIIHKHDCLDADFFDLDAMGGIHGLGIRHWVYWYDWLKKEVKSYLLDWTERFALGLTIYFYEDGNPQSEAQAIKAAKQDGRNTIIVWPRSSTGRDVGPGIQRVEAATGGAQVIDTLLSYFDDKLERFIIGQTLSSDHRGSGGLGGSGASDFQRDTKYRIIKSDAENLAETLTEDLIGPLQRYNLPRAKFKIRFAMDVDHPDPESKLGAITMAYNMGTTFVMDEVRELTGMRKPSPTDEILQSPQQPATGSGTEQGQPGADQPLEDDTQDQGFAQLLAGARGQGGGAGGQQVPTAAPQPNGQMAGAGV